MKKKLYLKKKQSPKTIAWVLKNNNNNFRGFWRSERLKKKKRKNNKFSWVEEDEEKWANVEVWRVLKTNNIFSWVLNLLCIWIKAGFYQKKKVYAAVLSICPIFFLPNFSTTFMLRSIYYAAYKIFSTIDF